MQPPPLPVSSDVENKPDWLGYYRDSAADAAAFTFDVGSLRDAEQVSFDDLKAGGLPAEIVDKLLKVSKEARKGRSKKNTLKEPVSADAEPVNLLVVPWIYNPQRYHGHRMNDWRKPFVPVFLFAQMDAEGKLSPLDRGRPLIPRDRLLPVEHNGPIIGNLVDADAFATANDFAPTGWADSLEYAERLVTAVSESAPDKLDCDGYQLAQNACVMSLDEGRTKNPSAALLRLYDLLQNAHKAQSVDFSTIALSGLLKQAGKSADDRAQPPAYEGLSALAISAKHFATTSAQYPLARSQRLALLQLITLKRGDALAI